MSDSYWYPSNTRLAALQRDLSTRGRQLLRSEIWTSGEFVPLVLKAILRSNAAAGFPTHQIARWIWVALQFHSTKDLDPATEDFLRGSLVSLTMLLAKSALSEADVKDITWVLDAATNFLTKHAVLDQEQKEDESAKILLELENDASLGIFDAETVEKALAQRNEELKALSASPNFTTIGEKLAALLELAFSKSAAAQLAQKSLLAISERNLAANEIDRPLDILRDVHIIEAAYSAATGLTPQLSLLNKFQQQLPFVAALPILGTPPRPLDRYTQYVVYICLHILLHRSASLLVVRNSGVHTVIASIVAAIEAMMRETEFTSSDVKKWTKNQAVTISDGTRTFRANYIGAVELSGKKKFWLGVRESGAITVDEGILPFIATAPEPHKSLSLGNDIQTWLKERHPDPLVFLTGSSRRRLMRQDGILLLAPKNKFDEYIGCLHPLGASSAALLGLTYVSSNFEFENLNGTTVETPKIYVCSDSNVAVDLIREPPEHIARWRVVVDGAKSGAALLAAFPNLDRSNAKSICVVGELHEREASCEIIDRGTSALFLDHSQVEIPSRSFDVSTLPQDAASKNLACQSNQSKVAIEFHSVNDSFLEELSLIIRGRTRRSDEGHLETTSLDLQLSDFLKKAISRPIRSDSAKRTLNLAAQRILEQASMDRQYDDGADRIYALFDSYLKSNNAGFDRSDALRGVIESAETTETVAVLCRSENIARECDNRLPPNFALRNVEWVTIQKLRKLAPRDRVIVPGWLDRFAMRELSNSGYGRRLDFILLPFERAWLSSTLQANDRFEKQLSSRGLKLFGDLAGDLKIDVRPPAEPPLGEATAKNLADGSDVTDIEKVEARAVDTLLRSVAQPKEGQATANAQLVLFEEAGSYAYLPPTGKVIVLPEHEAPLDERKLEAGLAEQLLFRGVDDLASGMVLALPVETDRDLVDARADLFLTDAVHVRSSAAIWKDAIRRHIANDPVGHIRFAERLTEAGRSRQASTVRSWISQSATVAPSNYRQLIPLIARLTSDAELQLNFKEVMQSVDQIYRAKSRAAAAIVRELFSGVIDKEQDELVFDLNGHQVKYQLRRVKSLAGIRKVPVELIGRSSRITNNDRAALGFGAASENAAEAERKSAIESRQIFPAIVKSPQTIGLIPKPEFATFHDRSNAAVESEACIRSDVEASPSKARPSWSDVVPAGLPAARLSAPRIEPEPSKGTLAAQIGAPPEFGKANVAPVEPTSTKQDETKLEHEAALRNTKATPPNRINDQINFEAFATLRKWPSVGSKPLSGSSPYLVMDATLERCMQKFVSLPQSQSHLYEIHTAPQPPLISAVMLLDEIVEINRLLQSASSTHAA